jgi:hypothetical protein
MGKRSVRSPQRHVLITVGAPNYDERAFIKKTRKEGKNKVDGILHVKLEKKNKK